MTSRIDAIETFAPAKINLFLHVGERRADGFHDLESLVVFAGAGDALSLAQSTQLTLEINGSFAPGLKAEGDNLVLRAARALAQHANRPASASMTLTKNLPVASGIGGGSADAAAALRGLARLWALDVSWQELRTIGETLGSDVPVCIECKPSWMEGRGERVTPSGAVAQMAMVLVNPGVAVPTAEIFRGLAERRGTGTVDHSAQLSRASDLIAFLKTTSNDLEAPARKVAPVIGDVLNELSRMPSAQLWRMSGSGATCFALFEDESAAEMAATAISHSHPTWWVQATQIGI